MTANPIKELARRLAMVNLKMRRAGDRSKYVPHQGAKECARRRKQRGLPE